MSVHGYHAGVKRTRCDCVGCARKDCEDCSHCKDMKKYGGPGIKKKRCIHRQCERSCVPTSKGTVQKSLFSLLYDFIILVGDKSVDNLPKVSLEYINIL